MKRYIIFSTIGLLLVCAQTVLAQASPISFATLTLSSNKPLTELSQRVGKENISTVLGLNRIDREYLRKGTTLVIPSIYDWQALSPFPERLAILSDTPKLLLFSARVQAFGVYHYGQLLRWGPISSGKRSTPTPAKLYFTTWKSTKIRSTVDPSWILPWTFNLDNFLGINMHQYELPGYPASHACIRLRIEDATWLYTWADEWQISRDGKKVLAHGTPVVVLDSYDFTSSAPWKKLPENPTATTLTIEELSSLLAPTLQKMQ